MKSNRLTLFIVLAMLAGIAAGQSYRTLHPEEAAIKAFADNVSVLSDVFMNLIKMVIAPLVFSTLVVGMAKVGDMQAVGRIGVKALAYFIAASLASLLLGMVLVNLFEPGVGLHLPLPPAGAETGIQHHAFSLREFVSHVFPKSIAEAMAKNEILQIVVFSLFFGIAAAGTGEVGETLVKSLDGVAHVMLKVTGYIMHLAPFAVFGAMASVIAQRGLDVLASYGVFMAEFYLSLLILWAALSAFGLLILRGRLPHLLARIRGPLLLAFSTASSEAVYPKMLQELERFGVPNRIASFVLPLGYSFNLDGSMMYMTFASLFIAQAYGIELGYTQQLTMLLVLMLTSKGVAGVPRASLVVIAGTLSMFDIPEAGLLLLLPIDQFLDMGRSATNVVGNAIATSVVAKWEGGLAHHHAAER